MSPGPIGVFDSGYGGLTILRSLRRAMPDADFFYLGDNARAPYGTRSFETVYRFTLEAVEYLFSHGCHLVILACNTASSKALRSIQQRNLPRIDPSRRVLGVIRPTVEAVGNYSRNGHIGLVGTPGTVASRSYDIEISKAYPGFRLSSRACKLWAAIVEAKEADQAGADWYVRNDLEELFKEDPDIDTLILGCTHYPLLIDKIRRYIPKGVKILSQGEIVAASLIDYLRRHPEMDAKITRGGHTRYLTTEEASSFSELATMFMGHTVQAEKISYDRLQVRRSQTARQLPAKRQ